MSSPGSSSSLPDLLKTKQRSILYDNSTLQLLLQQTLHWSFKVLVESRGSSWILRGLHGSYKSDRMLKDPQGFRRSSNVSERTKGSLRVHQGTRRTSTSSKSAWTLEGLKRSSMILKVSRSTERLLDCSKWAQRVFKSTKAPEEVLSLILMKDS